MWTDTEISWSRFWLTASQHHITRYLRDRDAVYWFLYPKHNVILAQITTPLVRINTAMSWLSTLLSVQTSPRKFLYNCTSSVIVTAGVLVTRKQPDVLACFLIHGVQQGDTNPTMQRPCPALSEISSFLHLSEKTIYRFPVSPGSAEALVRWGG